MPGCVMAMGRLNRPSLMIYGGTIKPGCLGDKKLDIISAFQSYGEYLAGKISDEERAAIVRRSCPGAGACGGMYTANTMASAIEAHGHVAALQLLDPGRRSRQARGMLPRGPGDPHAARDATSSPATS